VPQLIEFDFFQIRDRRRRVMAKSNSRLHVAYGAETIEEMRARIMQDANPAFRKALEEIQDWHDREARHSILARWDLAQLVKVVFDDVMENRGSKYGVHAIENVCSFFGWDEGVTRNALKLVQQFTKEEIDELCNTQMTNPPPISYSHLLCLMAIPDRGQRKQLIDKAVAENWTSKQLALEVSPDLKPKKPITDRRGRPLAVPRDLDAVLAQMGSFVDDFLNRAEKVWQNERHSLDAKFIDLSTDDITKERAERIKSVADKLGELTKKAKRLQEEALAVHKEFLKILDKKPAPKAIAVS